MGGNTIRAVGDIMMHSHIDVVCKRESLVKLGAALQTPL